MRSDAQKCAVTKGCLCSDKTIYQCMKMFKFKDLQSTMSFYEHCSFTYLWNMHLIQLLGGIHNATVVINTVQNLQSALSRVVLHIARPIVPICPPICHTGVKNICQKRLVKIMQFSPYTVNLYLQFLRHKFHSEILADSPEQGRQTRVGIETSFYASISRKRYKIKIVHSHC